MVPAHTISHKDSLPILLINFNRPELSRQVFEAVRTYSPSRIYFACDGPREDHENDFDLIAEVKREFCSIDWQGEVKFRTEPTNLGLRRFVISSIDWFFSNEKYGVILEDDCVPSQDFFRFAEHVLTSYENDFRVMGASGSNTFNLRNNNGDSYSFIRFPGIWGWASWSNRWEKYDRDLDEFARFRNGQTDFQWPTRHARHALEWHLLKLSGEEPDTWDYQWAWTVLLHNGYWAFPTGNLVQNIGIGASATHTKKLSLGLQEFTRLGPVKPPERVVINEALDLKFAQLAMRVFRPFWINFLRDAYRSVKYSKLLGKAGNN